MYSVRVVGMSPMRVTVVNLKLGSVTRISWAHCNECTVNHETLTNGGFRLDVASTPWLTTRPCESSCPSALRARAS